MRNTQYRGITVKEDPKTSLAEAGIYNLKLTNGQKAVAVAHLYFPHHDRNLVDLVLQYLRDTKPEVVFLLGGIVDEEAFKDLGDTEANYLHATPDSPEVAAAREAGLFQDQVLALGASCGAFIRSFQEASGGKVIYIPSATHLSMPNEVRVMEYIQQKKLSLDRWQQNHPKSPDKVSDPNVILPKRLAKLFDIHNDRNIQVLPYNAAVLLNGKTLFMVGDFRRRNAGDSSQVEWEQRGYSIVRSFDAKVASGWQTTPEHTLPGLTLNFHEFHEVGYLWDVVRMGFLRDYDRRCPGFWAGVIVESELFGQSYPIIRGTDERRTFVVDGAVYTEPTPGGLPNGGEITLDPAEVTNEPRVEYVLPPEEGEESEDGEGGATGAADADSAAGDATKSE